MPTMLRDQRCLFLHVLADALLFALMFVPFCASAAETLPKVENFFQTPAISQVSISPDGRFLAMLLSSNNGRVNLATMDIATHTTTIVAAFADVDIHEYQWVNNRRLYFTVADLHDSQETEGPGGFAVDRDGKNYLALIQRSIFNQQYQRSRQLLLINSRLLTTLPAQDTDEVYMLQQRENAVKHIDSEVGLFRFNTRTGARSKFVDHPGDPISWIIDQTGQPRILTALDEDRTEHIYYLDPSNQQWRQIASFTAFSKDGFKPLFFAPDGSFYVEAHNGQDKAAVYAYDLHTGSLAPKPLVTLSDYDFSGGFIVGAKKILGVQYLTDLPETVWFDEKMKAVQAKVDTLLPHTVNRLKMGVNTETPYILVTASSDRQPVMYALFDTQTSNLLPVGNALPKIDPRQMAQKEMVRYTARDGLQIPAYLSLPANTSGKNLPMVVLVHGGPWVRGSNGLWNADAQFLASRGYVVLEPEYRGSTGFGFHHFQAGWKQWGLSMQDDIADGAKWAVTQGIADPKRICIAGASYGGYAVLMGLINNPEIFRCGIDWAGVTDIDLMYTAWTGDFPDEWKRYSMPVFIGDRDQDAAQLKITSPLENAARITQPLLLAYGGSDHRVPIVHGKKFKDAVSVNNHDVEWVEYPEEGHGWHVFKNRIDFWNRVEAFLNRNIGN